MKGPVIHISELAGFSTLQEIPRLCKRKTIFFVHLYKKLAASTRALSCPRKCGRPIGKLVDLKGGGPGLINRAADAVPHGGAKWQ